MCMYTQLHKCELHISPVVCTQIIGVEATQILFLRPLVLGSDFLLSVSLSGWQLAQLDMLSG